MNVKRILSLALAGSLLTGTALLVAGCSKGKQDESWKENTDYDLSVPTLGQDGWYLVFQDDFEGDGLNQNIQFGDNYTGSKEIWTTSPHAVRWQSQDKKHPDKACYWCPTMVEVKDSNLIIHSRHETNHSCDGDCPAAGRFTGGIEPAASTATTITTRAQRTNCSFPRRSATLSAG